MVGSALTVLVVAGMILTVMLTAGRSVAAQQDVLTSIDDAGTRSIIVTATDGAGLDSSVIDRLRPLQDVEWAGAFSSVTDATNSQIADGTKVPSRFLYTFDLSSLNIPAGGDMAYASTDALSLLRMQDNSGGISLPSGASFGIRGGLKVPDYLTSLEPLILIPRNPNNPEPVNMIVVIAKDARVVTPVTRAVLSLLGASDSTQTQVVTSERLAEVRELVNSDLTAFARTLVVGAVGISGALVALILFALVMLRRKDFGRRRALGASKSFIVSLLLIQTGILAAIGVALALIVTLAVSVAGRTPPPTLGFVSAVCILAIVFPITAAVLPAVAASRREPYRELRVA